MLRTSVRSGIGRGDIEFEHMADMLAALHPRCVRMPAHQTADVAWQSVEAVNPFAE